MSIITKSEILFEKFCEELEISVERISTGDKQTPDHFIFPDNNKIVVEIKQIDPNPDELKIQKTKKGVYRITPGQRVRKKISAANPQLKALSQGEYPSILVVFDNVAHILHTDRDEIKVAMYGLQQITLALPNTSLSEPYIKKSALGPRKRFTENHNTSTSAVAVLYEDYANANALNLDVYHNSYAAVKLRPDALRYKSIKHFTLSDALPEWKEV